MEGLNGPGKGHDRSPSKKKQLLGKKEAWGRALSTNSWGGLNALGLLVASMVLTFSQSVLDIYPMVPSVSGQLGLLWDIWDVLGREQ